MPDQPDLSVNLSIIEWNQIHEIMRKDPVTPLPEQLRAILEKTELITLSIPKWNEILQRVSTGPYNIVAPLVNKINMQANEQFAQASSSPVANGADEADQPAAPP